MTKKQNSDVITNARAMVREFEEETGMKLDIKQWRKFCILKGDSWSVHFFKTAVHPMLFKSLPGKNDVGEPLEVVKVEDMPVHSVITNLNWLIPMAIHDFFIHDVKILNPI